MENNFNQPEDIFAKPPQSYWMASISKEGYPELDRDVKVDVAIVGGGITGITAAYLLKKEGYKVAVIEADRILQGTTGHTTAKITSQHDLIYDKIKKKMGEEKAKLYADANENAIRFIADLIKEKNIDCDFSWRPAYVYTQKDEYVQKIADEAKAAAELGIKAHYMESIPLPVKIKAALRFDGQAQFHPLKYLLELAKDIPGDGSFIFEQTKAVGLEEGSTCAVITAREARVTAEKVIIASHYPFADKKGLYFARLFPERSYILGVKAKEPFAEGMFITAEDPGRSLRSQPFEDGELVLVGGEHHKTGQGKNMNDHYTNLMRFASEVLNVVSVPYRWSTQDYTPADEVPYIGRLTSDTPNIYVATGYRKWGMTNSTAGAILIRDLITKGSSPWESLYSPSRFTPAASAKNIVVENLDVAKHLISGKLQMPPEGVEVKVGEGRHVEINGQKAGAYRDEKGQLHLVDTTCTHLGCELQWNEAEKTWDCPCHGSRFTYEGDIVEGPALESIKFGEDTAQ